MPAAVGVMLKLPLEASLPVHAPDAVQEEASIVDQLKVVVAPTAIESLERPKIGVASAASAWMKPYPAVKLKVVLVGTAPTAKALFSRAE